jgi:cyclopropane-fatty-acyl-phospholipid synthase
MTSYITGPLARGADLVKSTVGSVSWGPALSVSKAAVTSLFSRIEKGTLVIEDRTTGQTKTYGRKLSRDHSKLTNGVKAYAKKNGGVGTVEVVVHKEAFWVRLFLFADMGFAESYMLGEFECNDLTGFFQVA